MQSERTSWNSTQVAKRINVALWRVRELVRQDILPNTVWAGKSDSIPNPSRSSSAWAARLYRAAGDGA